MTEPGKHSRRDFLRGKVDSSKLESADLPGNDSGDGDSDRELELTDSVQFFSHRAMACDFEIYFNDQQYALAGDAAIESFEVIDEMENLLSIYRADSPISQFNQSLPGDPFATASSVIEVLKMGREISARTGGAFQSMTAAPLSELWGDCRQNGRIPDSDAVEAALARVGNPHWELNETKLFLRKFKQDTTLNLGGIGKGYALDQCLPVFTRHGIDDFLIHGGNSSVLAGGNRRNRRVGKGWWVGIGHPVIPDKLIAEILLQDQALATSGTRRQGFVHQGKWYGHIIDPRNGYPASHVFSATAIASTAAEADALSTAFYVMGPEETGQYCESHSEISAILVVPREGSGFEFKSFNLDQGNLRVMPRNESSSP